MLLRASSFQKKLATSSTSLAVSTLTESCVTSPSKERIQTEIQILKCYLYVSSQGSKNRGGRGGLGPPNVIERGPPGPPMSWTGGPTFMYFTIHNYLLKIAKKLYYIMAMKIRVPPIYFHVLTPLNFSATVVSVTSFTKLLGSL